MTMHKIITKDGTRKAVVLEGAPVRQAAPVGPVTLCAGCAHVTDADFVCSLYVTDERVIGGRNVVLGCGGFVPVGAFVPNPLKAEIETFPPGEVFGIAARDGKAKGLVVTNQQ